MEKKARVKCGEHSTNDISKSPNEDVTRKGPVAVDYYLKPTHNSVEDLPTYKVDDEIPAVDVAVQEDCL